MLGSADQHPVRLGLKRCGSKTSDPMSILQAGAGRRIRRTCGCSPCAGSPTSESLELRDDVAKLLEGPQPSSQYYLAVLAAIDWLDHEPKMRGKQIADELLVRELENESRSPDAHALALRLLSPDNKFLSLDRLRGYLKSEHLPLRLEAVRTLSQQAKPKRFALLAEVAGDESQDCGTPRRSDRWPCRGGRAASRIVGEVGGRRRAVAREAKHARVLAARRI